MTDFGTTQSTCGQMLGAGHDRFVLKNEPNRKQQFKMPIQSSQQKLAGSTSVTPQCRNCEPAGVCAEIFISISESRFAAWYFPAPIIFVCTATNSNPIRAAAAADRTLSRNILRKALMGIIT